MRKRQSLADATALATELATVEAKVLGRQLTVRDADVIEGITAHVQALEKAKIIIAPQLLHRVRALAGVARRLRAIQAQGSVR